TIAIFLIGFGWGKPVEFRTQALSSERFGAAIVALAGPMMNLLLAVLGALALLILSPDTQSGTLFLFLRIFIRINVVLAVFNLIPLPPLDGSRLLTIFLPPNRQNIIFFLDRYGFVILLAILFFGGFTILSPIINTVEGWVLAIAGF
nr:site-2 protease family protein [Actinomycetota bacterium]